MTKQPKQQVACLLAALVMLSACGCAALRRPMNMFSTPGPVAPTVLQPTPALGDVIAAVNVNTARVRSYVTYDAKITAPGMLGLPLLSASIAAEQPGRFRLRASTAISGPEIDLGSNHEEFWFWIRRNEPPAIFHCRHDQFANSPARDMLPIEPSWVADAVGLVTLDANLPWEGPTPIGDGKLELRSNIYHPTGMRSRVTVVDAERAWVLQQFLYDSTGQLLASSEASQFVYDPVSQVSLPRKVSVNVPTQGLAFTIDMGNPSINVPPGDPLQLWTRPQIEGAPAFDLGAMPAARMGPSVGQASPNEQAPEVPFVAQALPREPQSSGTIHPQNYDAELDSRAPQLAPPVSRIPSTGISLPPY